MEWYQRHLETVARQDEQEGGDGGDNGHGGQFRRQLRQA